MKLFFLTPLLLIVSLMAFAETTEDAGVYQGGPMAGAALPEATTREPADEDESAPRSPAPQRQRTPPQRTLAQNDLCNAQMSVEASPEVAPTVNGRAIATCEMTLDSQFAEALQIYIPLCAKSAAASQRWSIPTHVTVQQMGGYVSRPINTPSGPGNSWSRHAVGKALDISALILSNGSSSYKIDLTDRTQNQNFYDAFRSCWDNSMRSFMNQRGRPCTCSIGHSHTHEPSNHLHDNHMHISLTCPSQPNVAGC